MMFEDYLAQLASKHLTRRLLPLESGTGPVVRIAGRDVLLFASTTSDLQVIRCCRCRGQGHSNLRSGIGRGPISIRIAAPASTLEEAPRGSSAESALTLGSGYLANIGAIPALISLRRIDPCRPPLSCQLDRWLSFERRRRANLPAQRHGAPGQAALKRRRPPNVDRDGRGLQHGRRSCSPR